ncbi:MFS transporter [Paenibacillus etheri]
MGTVPMAATGFSMLADTIEYGEWKTGMRTEGLVYSAGSFGSKACSVKEQHLSSGLIILIPYKLDKEYPQIIEDLKNSKKCLITS